MRILIISAVTLLLYAIAATLYRPAITRADLGLSQRDELLCNKPKLPIYSQERYSMIQAASDYIPFAVATLNAYGAQQTNEIMTGFTVSKHSPDWIWTKKIDYGNGLAFDLYRQEGNDTLTILTVFRGTETFDKSDWIANFSWLLAWLPIETQYDIARRAFERDVRSLAKQSRRGRKISFIAAGHSLGGGLAQHIAYSYPCVGAVVFNSSFVTNRYRLERPFDNAPVVHLFEDGDVLTRLRRLLLGESDTNYYRHYRLNAVGENDDGSILQHSMLDLATGMARQVLRCQQSETNCVVSRADTRIRKLYCTSEFAQIERTTAAICARNTSDEDVRRLSRQSSMDQGLSK